MKPIFRIALASLSGLILSWMGHHFRAVPDRAASVPVSVRNTAPSPDKSPRPEWLTWLEACAPLQPVTGAGEFWQRMPPVGASPEIEWKLALDEAFFTIPPEAFVAVLADERFSRFPRLYEEESFASWSRKLLGLGLEEALSMAGRMPTKWLNTHLEIKLREAFAKQDPERGYEWLKQSAGGQAALAGYLEQVVRFNVDKAAEMFGRLDAGSRWYGAYNILKTLGTNDWRKAEAWAKANLTPEEWKDQAGHVFDGYSGPRLAELYQIGNEITDPLLRSVAYSRAVFWPGGSSGKTLDRTLALPPGSLNSEGWKEVGQTCGMRELDSADPAAAAGTLRKLASLVPEQQRAEFLNGAVSMAFNDGPLGAQFYDILAPDDAGKLSGNWTKEDPSAASAWLATLAPSPKKEAAVLAFCREATSIDPAGAAAWALTLTDSSLRDSTLHGALAAWRQAQPAAAADWAAGKGIPGFTGSPAR